MIDRKLTLARVSSSATTYEFRCADRFGWAICTVNDATGELHITSDWGSWSYLWGTSPRSLGCATLTHFLGVNRGNGKPRIDVDYFAMKLLGRKGAYRFSTEKTTAHFHKLICERRWETAQGAWGYGRDAKLMTKEIARDLWNELASLASDIVDSCDGAETLYIERFLQLDNHEMLSQEPWEETKTESSNEWTILYETILPALAAACYEQTKMPAYQKLHAEFLVERAARDKREADAQAAGDAARAAEHREATT